jgi:nucleoside-diphosphate-sugar epimerase
LKVVLIGSEGFIGQEVKRQCRAANIELTTLDSVGSDEPNHRRVDICSRQLREYLPGDAQAIIHLAAISRDRDCARDPVAALNVNVAGTLNVFDAARSCGIPQLVFASTEWVYGDVAGQEAQAEDAPIDVNRLTSEYALSKLFAERLLHAGWLVDPVTAVTILRFAIVYGPRLANWSAVEQLFHQVQCDRTVEVGSLKTARRFIHVSDIARGILKALNTPGYEVFNLSGSRLVTLSDIVEESCQLLGHRPSVVETGLSPATIRNPTNAKAYKILAWQPVMELKAGLATLLAPPT